MKKIISKEASFCDHCSQESYVDACLKCGVEHCWKCRKLCGVVFKYALHFSGSDDGYYCKSCNLELSKSGADPMYNAYFAVAQLRTEEKLWRENFRALSEQAEKTLEQLCK